MIGGGGRRSSRTHSTLSHGRARGDWRRVAAARPGRSCREGSRPAGRSGRGGRSRGRRRHHHARPVDWRTLAGHGGGCCSLRLPWSCGDELAGGGGLRGELSGDRGVSPTRSSRRSLAGGRRCTSSGCDRLCLLGGLPGWGRYNARCRSRGGCARGARDHRCGTRHLTHHWDRWRNLLHARGGPGGHALLHLGRALRAAAGPLAQALQLARL